MDLCGADYPNRPLRFDVVYHLLSMTQNCRIRVKLQAGEETQVPSVTGCLTSPIGMSAKPSICMAFCFPAILICAVC